MDNSDQIDWRKFIGDFVDAIADGPPAKGEKDPGHEKAIQAFAEAEAANGSDDLDGEVFTAGTLVAVGGLSGSGKSTLARRLVDVFNAQAGPVDWIRTDAVRKELAGVPPEQKLPAEYYSSEFSARTYAEFERRVTEALEQGHTVVADGTFMKQEQRDGLSRLARESHAKFMGLWLDTPPDIMKARADARKGDVSDADSKVIDIQLKADLGSIDWERLDAGGTAEHTFDQAFAILKRFRPGL